MRPTAALVVLGMCLSSACERAASPPDASLDAAAVDVALDASVDVAADTGPDIVPYRGPEDWCPGRDHCRGEGDGRLYVGVARANINPVDYESDWTDANNNGAWDWTDLNNDGRFQPGEGEAFVDRNGNGVFDAAWIAGFGNARPARGVHDDLEVRALALRWNDVSVALAVIDCVGFFANEMDRVRADPMLQGLDLDKVILASTHDHEAVDTIGIWGPSLVTSERNPEYQALVRRRAAEAIRAAVMSAAPARMRVAQTLAVDPMGSTLSYVNDTRDPVLYDPTLTLVRFTREDDPTRTIATWVNWSSHPEYTGSRNNLLSADYVHTLRDTLEQGLSSEGLAGLGGTTVFINGALGGQVGPGGGVAPLGEDGQPIREAGLAKAAAAGRNVARLGLQALAREGVDVAEAPLSYRTAGILARVENQRYAIGYNQRLFDRELLYWDPRRPLGRNNLAWIESRVTYLQVGPVATISAPGELHPELWVGYDTRWSWGQPVLTETENRVDLAQAPSAPYLRDLILANPGVRWAFVSGLTEDFLGYIMPRINFVLNPVLPYIAEARGDHYEETNSIGPDAEDHLFRPMVSLVTWRPDAGR
ncbi:MAG: hypothetical protein R3A48_26805 [Polyangiales bacterium]